MNRWFAEVKTVEELRKRYRELLKKYHPDNENGSIEATQEINAEYDRLFASLSKENKSDSQSCIFRKNRALAPHERSAVPLGTDHCPVG